MKSFPKVPAVLIESTDDPVSAVLKEYNKENAAEAGVESVRGTYPYGEILNPQAHICGQAWPAGRRREPFRLGNLDLIYEYFCFRQ